MHAVFILLLLSTGCANPEAGEHRDEADSVSVQGSGAPETAPEGAYAAFVARFGENYEACGESQQTLPEECAEAAMTSGSPEHLNVELVLDASGSMAGQVGGVSKMEAAREALVAFVGTIPAGASVALRVYGHVGSNDEADKARSCAGTELLQAFGPLDEAAFEQAVASFEPTGWTPLAASLDAAGQDFAQTEQAEASENVVYLVSDGIETCDGDPVAAARRLHEQDVRAVVNVIGFDVDAEAARQLKAVAEAGGGTYIQADTQQELRRAFLETYAEAWARYNCVYAEQWGAYNETYRAQWARSNCLYRKAWAEYNAIYREVWRQDQAGEIDAETRQSVLAHATAKRNRILRPAQQERDRILQAARERRSESLDEAAQEHTEMLDSARSERDAGVDDPLP